MHPMIRGPYNGYDEHAVPMRQRSPPRYGGPGGPDSRGGYGGSDRGYNDYGGGGNERRGGGRGGRGRNRGRSRGGGGGGGGGGPPSAPSSYPAYDDGPMDPYYAPPPPQDDYYHDEYGSGGYDDASRRRPPPPPRRERETNENLIEERIQRERPCRTLFIRNIKYESNGDAIRARFEEFGEIKTFFDLIANRGMVFVTFFDLRAAERARDRLQGTDISGRPIDVHYSLPRENETNSRCNSEKNQGSLSVQLRDSNNRQPINYNEVRRIFAQYGDVKSVRPIGDGRDTVVAEMYDMRATVQIFETMNRAPLQDGYMELDWAWDIPDTPLPAPAPASAPPVQPLPRRPDPPPRERYEDDYREPGPRGGGGGRGKGRGRGRGGGGGYDDRDDFRGRRDSRGGHDDFEPRRSGGRQENRYPDDPYRGPGGGPPPGQPEPDRLEAAKKVQELLQALKQPASAQAQSPTRPPQPPPAPVQPPYYGAPPPQPAYQPPPPAVPSYPPAPVPAAGPQLIPNAATLAASLPPSVLALLQQANALGPAAQQAYQTPPPAAPNPYGVNPYSPPPAVAPGAPAPATGANPGAMQQILEMIAAQSKRVQ